MADFLAGREDASVASRTRELPSNSPESTTRIPLQESTRNGGARLRQEPLRNDSGRRTETWRAVRLHPPERRSSSIDEQGQGQRSGARRHPVGQKGCMAMPQVSRMVGENGDSGRVWRYVDRISDQSKMA